MKKIVPSVVTAIIIIAGVVMGWVTFTGFSDVQIQTLKVLGIICACAACYCFLVGEISGNNSQMDKLWSLLPIVYLWVVAGLSGMKPRLILMAILVTLWGMRLTFNFGRKGAYRLKFWEGREDYRWEILRKNTILKNRFLWGLFDLFFISIYQNALVLAICLPAVALMDSDVGLNYGDGIVAVIVFLFLLLETIADEQQWAFHCKKKELLSTNDSLESLPEPYNKGFNTTGIWAYMRHPNYLGEQAFWIALYLFTIPAAVTTYGLFNWSIFGCLFLLLLFMGSSAFGESISSSKYPEYRIYQNQVFKYLPLRKYKGKE